MRHNEAGMSLMGALVALAISGVVIASMTQMLGNSMATQRHMEFEEEMRSLRSTIEKRLTC